MGAGGLVARLVAPGCSKTMVRLRQVASGCARLRGCVFCQNSGQVAFQVARNLCPSLPTLDSLGRATTNVESTNLGSNARVESLLAQMLESLKNIEEKLAGA